MSWYKGYYGTWNDPNGVISIGGSYSRKEMIKKAQKTANETGKTVTILIETPNGHGLTGRSLKINPE